MRWCNQTSTPISRSADLSLRVLWYTIRQSLDEPFGDCYSRDQCCLFAYPLAAAVERSQFQHIYFIICATNSRSNCLEVDLYHLPYSACAVAPLSLPPRLPTSSPPHCILHADVAFGVVRGLGLGRGFGTGRNSVVIVVPPAVFLVCTVLTSVLP